MACSFNVRNHRGCVTKGRPSGSFIGRGKAEREIKIKRPCIILWRGSSGASPLFCQVSAARAKAQLLKPALRDKLLNRLVKNAAEIHTKKGELESSAK